MELFKSAVAYFVRVTGKPYTYFFDNLDLAMSMNVDVTTSNNLWLINKLAKELEKTGFTVTDMKINKDTVKAIFDNKSRVDAGEYYTQEIWCKFARDYLLDRHVPNWREYNVWDNSCGTGNLMRTANHNVNKLFLSTLYEDDVNIVLNTPEYQGATVFQLNFLMELDFDKYNTAFTNKLPQRLQEILRNDEPLIIYVNPPYRGYSASATDVGIHMQNVGLSTSAYDLYYQFLYRFMSFVEIFNLTNLYVCNFGPLVLFTGYGGHDLLLEYEKYFKFIDGFCISAEEFMDTSTVQPWGIACTLWKSKGAYADYEHTKTYMHKAMIAQDEKGIKTVKVAENPSLFEFTEERLSHWATDKEIMYYELMPTMTYCCGFKGSPMFSNKAPYTNKIAVNALGTIMADCVLCRSHEMNAVFTCPASQPYINITEENFWKCVAMFTAKSCYEDDNWVNSKKELSAPDTTVEGYSDWLYNGLVLFLFDWKAMQSSHRQVEVGTGDFSSKIDFQNKMFPISAEEVKQYCHDEVILADLEKFPPKNEFILKQIEISRPYWKPEVAELFEYCKMLILNSYDDRKHKNYHADTMAWDAGFYQIKYLDNICTDTVYKELLSKLSNIRAIMLKESYKFGFLHADENEF